MIGLHLMIDGTTYTPVNREQIEKTLTELPSRIDMKILLGPFIVRGHQSNPGWTGFVIIDKSHISIHTFDEGNLISVDIFSCKTFETEEVKTYLENILGLQKIHSTIVIRDF
jgi:S-adenosylmethionine decarboxylase